MSDPTLLVHRDATNAGACSDMECSADTKLTRTTDADEKAGKSSLISDKNINTTLVHRKLHYNNNNDMMQDKLDDNVDVCDELSRSDDAGQFQNPRGGSMDGGAVARVDLISVQPGTERHGACCVIESVMSKIGVMLQPRLMGRLGEVPSTWTIGVQEKR